MFGVPVSRDFLAEPREAIVALGFMVDQRTAEVFMAHSFSLPENEKALYAEIMKAYIDTAKGFTQLSAAAHYQ